LIIPAYNVLTNDGTLYLEAERRSHAETQGRGDRREEERDFFLPRTTQTNTFGMHTNLLSEFFFLILLCVLCDLRVSARKDSRSSIRVVCG